MALQLHHAALGGAFQKRVVELRIRQRERHIARGIYLDWFTASTRVENNLVFRRQNGETITYPASSFAWCGPYSEPDVMTPSLHVITYDTDLTDPDHHLWRNGRLYWVAFTVHLPGWQKERIRLSLGTADVTLAGVAALPRPGSGINGDVTEG